MRFLKGAFVVLLLLTLGAAIPGSRGVAAADDPATLLQRFNDARNSGDVSGAVALVTDDVRFAEGPTCQPDRPCIGAVAVRRELENGLAVHVQGIVVGMPVVTGSSVRFRAEVYSDPFTAVGVARIIVNGTVEVRDGKIASYIDIPDMSDAQTAKFFALNPLGPPNAPGGPGGSVIPSAVPRSGGGYGASIIRRLGDG